MKVRIIAFILTSLFFTSLLCACASNSSPNTAPNNNSGTQNSISHIAPQIELGSGLDFEMVRDNTTGTIYYSVVSPGSNLDTNLVVPSTYDNLPVAAISSKAFYECKYLESIVFPNSLKYIGPDSFTRCTGLKSVEIPYGVIQIREYAFNRCTGLSSVTIPNTVTRINVGAFQLCESLVSIKFEGSMAEWMNIIIEDEWNYRVPAIEVNCNDGNIPIR